MSTMLEHHRRVLLGLAECTIPNGEFCSPFKRISDASGIKDVRNIVRHLARKGYAQYFNGLVRDDGRFAGAGYCITQDGLNALGMGPKP